MAKIRHNTQTAVQLLKARGISVTGVTKAVCGHPAIAQAMLDGGAVGLAEARLSNVQRLRDAGITSPITLLRTPMLSQTEQIVQFCEICNEFVRRTAQAFMATGPDRHLIHFRSQGLTGRNGTQIIHRIAKRALGEQATKVNWYSIRHTLIDWLEMRVPQKSLSMLAGHISAFDTKERRQFRQNVGSKTTLIYLRQKLVHLDPIRKALDEEWWPEIQMHCKLDLRLGDPKLDCEWAEARKIGKK